MVFDIATDGVDSFTSRKSGWRSSSGGRCLFTIALMAKR